MRRLRRLFALLSGLSLLLCVAASVLWVRSPGGDVFAKLGPRGFELVSSHGRLSLTTYQGFPASYPFRWRAGNAPFRYWDVDGYRYSGEGVWPWLARWTGVSEGYTDYAPTGAAHLPRTRASWKSFAAPHWLAVLLFGVAPALWVRRAAASRAAGRRAAAGLCPACGYDLRATPDRCPECGAVPADARAVMMPADSSPPART